MARQAYLAAGHKHKPKAQIAQYADNAIKRIGDIGWACERSKAAKVIEVASKAQSGANDIAMTVNTKRERKVNDKQVFNPLTGRWTD